MNKHAINYNIKSSLNPVNCFGRSVQVSPSRVISKNINSKLKICILLPIVL